MHTRSVCATSAQKMCREPVPAVQVLQDALCGSSKVMLVCNLSPEAASAGETLSSLNFASRAAQVKTRPAQSPGP